MDLGERLMRRTERALARRLWTLLWPEIKRRRRVARPIAALGLIRHGATMYGIHLGLPPGTIEFRNGTIQVTNCRFERVIEADDTWANIGRAAGEVGWRQSANGAYGPHLPGQPDEDSTTDVGLP